MPYNPDGAGDDQAPLFTSADSDAIREMHGHADGVVTHLRESWLHHPEGRTTLERVALWHAVRLDLACEQSIETSSVERLISSAPPDERYETLAALWAIPRLVPFRSEVERLRRVNDMEGEDWGEHMAMEEAQAVTEWHEWVSSQKGLEVSIGRAADRGSASVFAIAAERLADCLLQSLARHHGFKPK